jgi:hypothetical protein
MFIYAGLCPEAYVACRAPDLCVQTLRVSPCSELVAAAPASCVPVQTQQMSHSTCMYVCMYVCMYTYVYVCIDDLSEAMLVQATETRCKHYVGNRTIVHIVFMIFLRPCWCRLLRPGVNIMLGIELFKIWTFLLSSVRVGILLFGFHVSMYVCKGMCIHTPV